MLPVIAIIGRPNVGKSTLFNVLTRSRNALVADQPGVTRDRQFGKGRWEQRDYILIDTGGFTDEKDPIAERITHHALLAIQESHSVLLLVDGKDGLSPGDITIATHLRQLAIPVYIVVNKTEGIAKELASAEFYSLGFDKIYPISAAHKHGIEALLEAVFAALPPLSEENEPPLFSEGAVKVAVIGRPNVGKSTLINRLLGYERVITFDQPGTTRDSIYIPFERRGQQYVLIDTAGVRRRARLAEDIEKISVIKTLQTINNASVVILLLDANEGVANQDTTLLGMVLDAGRALVIAVNKWDGLSSDQRETVRSSLSRKLHFIDFAKIHFISALHGSGVGDLFGSINRAWQSASQQVTTPRLNELLQQAITAHSPPAVQGRRIKLRYIHQGGQNPPLFIIHGNQVDSLPDAYKRYLINFFREALALEGTPISLEFKQGENPYQGRKNVLTPHQQKKRQRLLRHVKS